MYNFSISEDFLQFNNCKIFVQTKNDCTYVILVSYTKFTYLASRGRISKEPFVSLFLTIEIGFWDL